MFGVNVRVRHCFGCLTTTHQGTHLQPHLKAVMSIHPSVDESWVPPPHLEPREEMPPYDECWCQSGKKWKWCHRNRAQQNRVPIGQITSEMIATASRGRCLHPMSGSDCERSPVSAHTIQRRGGLAAIAEDGHVISPKRGYQDIFKNSGDLIPRLMGIRQASTFMGFCDRHDDALFAPIEKNGLTLTAEAAFLLSFRAICYELHAKETSLSHFEILRQLDLGTPYENQCVIQEHLHCFMEGTKRGLSDVSTWKAGYDNALTQKDFKAFSFFAIILDEMLPIVACGAFHPEFDFAGQLLQIVSRGNAPFEHVCFNLTAVNNKSVVVFGYTGTSNGPAAQFVSSFRALDNDSKANAAFHVACEHLENIYLRPSWWNAQTDTRKDYLITRFRSGAEISNGDRQSNCLLSFGEVLSAAGVEHELAS